MRASKAPPEGGVFFCGNIEKNLDRRVYFNDTKTLCDNSLSDWVKRL